MLKMAFWQITMLSLFLTSCGADEPSLEKPLQLIEIWSPSQEPQRNAVTEISISQVPDCWITEGKGPFKEAEYSIQIEKQKLDKTTLIKLLYDVAMLWHMVASYPSFFSNCAGHHSPKDCIIVHVSLSDADRAEIKSGKLEKDFVKKGVEANLARLLKYEGVSVSCVLPPQVCVPESQ